MFEIAENVKKFIIDSMQTRKVELSSSGNCKRLEVIHTIEEEFSRAICFVHDSINNGFEIIKSRLWSCEAFKVNHLSMDDLKLFGKSEHQTDSLVQTVQWLSEDIGI